MADCKFRWLQGPGGGQKTKLGVDGKAQGTVRPAGNRRGPFSKGEAAIQLSLLSPCGIWTQCGSSFRAALNFASSKLLAPN